MKKWLCILFFISLISCNKQPQASENVVDNITATDSIDIRSYYTKEDTVTLLDGNGEIICSYAKDEFNKIVDDNPELLSQYPEDPYKLYDCKKNYSGFGSEVGQDAYFVLYSYIQKQKNGIKEYEQERKRLIDIYSNINSLFQSLQHGGTYFGHQSVRILGYAEYSVYLYRICKEDINESYSVTKQKDLYVKSLHQLVEDECDIDVYSDGEEKGERLKYQNGLVNNLDKLITNVFYLKRAQEFHYRFYEYY